MTLSLHRTRAAEPGGGPAGGPPRQVPHRTLILSAGALVLVGALLIWLVAFSSILGVKAVDVRGVSAGTAGQVRAAARIVPGTPLLRIDAGAVARRVEQVPEVASATVRTSYPSTIVITVVARVAIGYVRSGGRYLLVDRTGYQFRASATRPVALPLFVVPSGSQAVATGRAVATVAASLPPALLARVASIQAFDPGAITLLLTDQRVVRWGSAARSSDKARILPALLAQPGTRYDLSNPDLPFTH